MSNRLEDVDPGIARVVAWLRAAGFDTTDSGDGVTKLAQGFTVEDGVLETPHVHMMVEPGRMVEESDRLAALVQALGIPLTSEDWTAMVLVDATYHPLEKVAVLSLFGLGDALLPEGAPVIASRGGGRHGPIVAPAAATAAPMPREARPISRPGVPAPWLSVIKRDLEVEALPWADEASARNYFDMAQQQWSDAWLCRVEIGPRDIGGMTHPATPGPCVHCGSTTGSRDCPDCGTTSWARAARSSCKPGAWGGPGCLAHEGHEIGPDGLCVEGRRA